MAGHNKWSSIKHKKGKEDARRAKIFTKLGRAIMVAAREGGGDIDYNPTLKAAVEKARAENMPNDNISRAIKRGTGELAGSNFENITYEGYGPEGIAFIVECLTDNRNRTAAEIRHAFDKYGGNLGTNGSVSFMFDLRGTLVIEKGSIDEDELMLEAIELGAEDFISEGDFYEIYTEIEDFNRIRDALKEIGYKFKAADLMYIPENYQKITNKDNIDNIENLIEILEDNDDVQEVYNNWDVDDEEE